MDTDRWFHVKEIFCTALKRNPDELEAFLDEACGQDPDLRREVEALLSSKEQSNDFLELPGGAGLLEDEPAETLASTRIGQYILESVFYTAGLQDRIGKWADPFGYRLSNVEVYALTGLRKKAGPRKQA